MIDSFRKKYAFLSNFYTSPLIYEGTTYKSVEHAFQAAKSLDPEVREKIAAIATAAGAKAAGQKIVLRTNWEEIKISIMEEILLSKFSNMSLRDKLIATGDEELVEGNNHGDKFWGVCDGEGRNELGKALMNVRSKLIMEQGKSNIRDITHTIAKRYERAAWFQGVGIGADDNDHPLIVLYLNCLPPMPSTRVDLDRMQRKGVDGFAVKVKVVGKLRML